MSKCRGSGGGLLKVLCWCNTWSIKRSGIKVHFKVTIFPALLFPLRHDDLCLRSSKLMNVVGDFFPLLIND